jgi:dihydropteroate synthase
MRILDTHNATEIRKIMRDMRVDNYGIDIMLPKALPYLIKINNASNIAANILKQEMLSLGAEVAVARGALTGQTKRTDCLLIGNLSQFRRLAVKLRQQPFRQLRGLSSQLSDVLRDYQKEDFVLNLGRYKLNLGQRTYIMGIVNLTPDSFSGDGLYQTSALRPQPSGIVDYIEKMVKDGADIIDIGGESSRPGARPVSIKEELNRTIGVIKKLVKRIKVPISIDTCKPQVAEAALDCGASIINDITALRNPRMRKLASQYGAGVVLMHMKGSPRNMQKKAFYRSLIEEVVQYLACAIKATLDCGVKPNRIIVDPGIGFAKTLQHNLTIIKNLKSLKMLGYPILVGPSRKSFIGKILNKPPQNRLFGTLAAVVTAAIKGAHIVRVHDVKEAKEALKIADALTKGHICKE